MLLKYKKYNKSSLVCYVQYVGSVVYWHIYGLFDLFIAAARHLPILNIYSTFCPDDFNRMECFDAAAPIICKSLFVYNASFTHANRKNII